MPNFALSYLERIYAQVEASYGVIPNTTGTATVGNNNACRLVRSKLDNNVALIARPDKTGTLEEQVGILGRKNGVWSAEMSVSPNGTAGVLPDCDPFLQGI